LYDANQMRIGILSAELGYEDVHENKRLAFEIRLRGHRPKIINYQKTVIVTTKNRRELYQPDRRGVLQKIKVNAVIPRINEADEQSINLACMALEVLIANGIFSTASPEAIRLAKNKTASLMRLAGAGIAIPRSASLTGTQDHIDIDKVLKIVEPNTDKRLIVKTNTGTQGKGVMSAKTRGEAGAIVDGFLANNIPVMLQQFMEPTKKDQYIDLRIMVINGKCVGAMKRTSVKKDEIRANLSLGGKGSSYKPTELEAYMAQKAAESLGLLVAGVDILPSFNQRVVIEVNSSPGLMIEQVANVNIAKKIVDLAITNAVKDGPPKTKKVFDKLNTEIDIAAIKKLPKKMSIKK